MLKPMHYEKDYLITPDQFCVNEAPNERDVEALFINAWKAKKEWAEKLILTENSLAEDDL